MKLSDFKQSKVKKVLRFIDGEMQIENKGILSIDGEIEFYTINQDLFEKINKELLEDLEIKSSDELFMYKIIPYLCNVEMDITFEEFKELLHTTNEHFLKFVEMIIELLNETLDVVDTLENIENNANEILEKSNLIESETDIEKLNRLYDELDVSIDVNDKRKLIKEITALEEKIGINV